MGGASDVRNRVATTALKARLASAKHMEGAGAVRNQVATKVL